MIRKLACLLAIMASPSAALASTANWGTVSGYSVLDGYNVVVFFTDGTRGGTAPACNTVSGRWAVKSQAAIATLLTAITTHRKIAITGSGTCSVWGDSETADVIGLPD